jgi:aminopeptidase N
LQLLNPAITQKVLSVPDRLGIIRDAFSLAESGNLATHDVLELALSYIDEGDYTVWTEVASGIGHIGRLIHDEKFYPQYQAYARQIFEKIAMKLGWEKKKAEKHTDSLLRPIVLFSLGTNGHPETIHKAQELFKQITSGKGKIDADLRGVIYNLVAENGGEKEYEALINLYRKETLQEEKNRIVRALSAFKNKTLLSKTLKFSLSKEVRSQDTIIVTSNVWINPVGKKLAWDFIKSNWGEFQKRFAGSHFISRMIEPAKGFTKKEEAQDFKNFFKKNKVKEAQRTILQVLEKIESNILWLKRDTKGIAKFLEKY